MTDYRQDFTDRVIDAIESGNTLPWERPWSAGALMPRNAISEAEYSGINRLNLAVAMIDGGYADNRFVTFRQAIDLGGAVRKGEHGHIVERFDVTPFWQRKDVEVRDGGRPVKVESESGRTAVLQGGKAVEKDSLTVVHDGQSMPWSAARVLNSGYSKTFVVFNVEQCDGLEKLKPLEPRTEKTTDERFDGIVAGMKKDGLLVQHTGTEAYYSPRDDRVVVPAARSFATVGDYQSTVLHEIGHATGAEKRLNRDGITGGHKFGTEGYAKEELRAELISAFVALETGISRARDEQHAAYMQSWAAILKESKHEIFKAAADASRAVDYIRERERTMNVDRKKTIEI